MVQRQQRWLCTAMAALEFLPDLVPDKSHTNHCTHVICPDKLYYAVVQRLATALTAWTAMKRTAATADLGATCWGWGMPTSQMMKQTARKPAGGRWAAAQTMQSSCDWLLHKVLKHTSGADSALPKSPHGVQTCWLLHQGLWQEARTPICGRCSAAHMMLPAIGFPRQL